MKRLGLLTIPLALAACEREVPAPTPSPTPTIAAPRTLVGADFDTLELGGRIQGPQGPEVETALSAGNREIGRMTSFVACPKAIADCNPAALPDGTIYTYVHRVTLAEADSAPTPTATSAAPGATLFRTTRAAHGFDLAIGYSREQALAALGEADALKITVDQGQLIWRVTKGEGWKPGTTITFWWTSTVPPKGPDKAYAVEIDGEVAAATGPFPGPEKADDKPAGL